MPMTWNAEADAKLLMAIIQVYDVKPSGVKLNEVAAIMGADCTPKALTHRLAKLKALVKQDGKEGSEAGENGVKETSTPTPKKRGRGKKTATPTSKANGGGNDDGDGDGDGDEEEGGAGKKIKAEAGEDDAEGDTLPEIESDLN